MALGAAPGSFRVTKGEKRFFSALEKAPHPPEALSSQDWCPAECDGTVSYKSPYTQPGVSASRA